MNRFIQENEKVAALCRKISVNGGIESLLDGLAEIYPDLSFSHVITRGGWYRLGGVVDAGYARISDNIARWAEQESGGDIEELLARYIDRGYFATRLSGQTHYFAASVGDAVEDYVQLEIEEIQEVLDRPLIDRDWFPDSLEEFLDPLDYPRLEPEPVSEAYYLFRRLTSISQLLNETNRDTRLLRNIRHFFSDWGRSSAGEHARFCTQWILALREYVDSDGSNQVNAKPVCVGREQTPVLPDGESLSGSALANAIHDYDRKMGYPFSWYFMMLTSQSKNFQLADAVLRDQAGAYDYLAARDLQVLREWESSPYSV